MCKISRRVYIIICFDKLEISQTSLQANYYCKNDNEEMRTNYLAHRIVVRSTHIYAYE